MQKIKTCTTQSNQLNFRKENILKFAALSGDYNPVHLDPIKARRTIFGDIVVHGLYADLSSINQCFKDNFGFVFIEIITWYITHLYSCKVSHARRRIV